MGDRDAGQGAWRVDDSERLGDPGRLNDSDRFVVTRTNLMIRMSTRISLAVRAGAAMGDEEDLDYVARVRLCV